MDKEKITYYIDKWWSVPLRWRLYIYGSICLLVPVFVSTGWMNTSILLGALLLIASLFRAAGYEP